MEVRARWDTEALSVGQFSLRHLCHLTEEVFTLIGVKGYTILTACRQLSVSSQFGFAVDADEAFVEAEEHASCSQSVR